MELLFYINLIPQNEHCSSHLVPTFSPLPPVLDGRSLLSLQWTFASALDLAPATVSAIDTTPHSSRRSRRYRNPTVFMSIVSRLWPTVPLVSWIRYLEMSGSIHHLPYPYRTLFPSGLRARDDVFDSIGARQRHEDDSGLRFPARPLQDDQGDLPGRGNRRHPLLHHQLAQGTVVTQPSSIEDFLSGGHGSSSVVIAWIG